MSKLEESINRKTQEHLKKKEQVSAHLARWLKKNPKFQQAVNERAAMKQTAKVKQSL